MEEYLSSIIENNKNDNNEKYEVLFICDIENYRSRMSKNYIRFIDYLRDNLKKYKMIYYGSGIPGFIRGLPLLEVIKKFCKTINPIVWMCDTRGPTMIRNSGEYRGIKIYDYEDVVGKIKAIIREVNMNNYSHVFYKYDCKEGDYIKQMCPNAIFYRYDHYIDNDIYKDWGLKKDIDVLCYGCIGWGFYPFRERLFKLFMQERSIHTVLIDHPMYGDRRRHNIIDDELSKMINRAKLTVVTPSLLEFFLKKYTETTLSNSCMLGRLPKKNAEKYEGCIVEIDEDMTDDEIIKKVRYYLKNEKELEEKTRKGKEIGEKYFTYKTGCEYMENILDSIVHKIK